MDTSKTTTTYLPLRPSKSEEYHFMKYLRSLYLDTGSDVALSSPRTVLRRIRESGIYSNIGLKRLTKYMGSFDSYSLLRDRHTSKKRTRRYINDLPGHQLEIDLMSVERYASDNQNYKFLITCIDTSSRKLYVEPLYTKEANTVVLALDKILAQAHYQTLRNIHSDLGIEFTNRIMRAYIKSRGITQTFAGQSTHANIVERVNRTLRRLMRLYMRSHNTNVYIDRLQDLVSLYNRRSHNSLQGLAPAQVTDTNVGYINILNKSKWVERTLPKQYKFSIGATVRISTARTVFDKHELPFTSETFIISARFVFDRLNIYQVTDCSNELINGFFYEHELLEVYNDPEKTFVIEKFLEEEKRPDGVYVLVKFKNYPDKAGCNAWVKKSDLQGN